MSHAQPGDSVYSYTDQRQFDAKSAASKESQRMRSKADERKFFQFFNEWRQNQIYVYKDHIKANYRQGQYEVEVDWSDLVAFDSELAGLVRLQPVKYLPLFERAALEIVAESMVPKPKESDLEPIQLMLRGIDRPDPLRLLGAKNISKIVCVSGIVISTHKVACKATTITIQCSSCKQTQILKCPKGFGSAPIPRVCPNAQSQDPNCPLDPFVVMPDLCKFVDTQKLRLQEMPEDVPTGEMPRHIMLACDRNLVSKANPGARMNVIGIYSIFQTKQKGKNSKASANVRYPYVRVIGLQPDTSSISAAGNFSPEEQSELEALGRDPDLYEKLTQSLAPSIFGHQDIKKAITCLLFGGTRKFLPSGSKLRGDINILLMGDPSVAKSQLLKGVEKSAPIAVYTSGKGSSAAGLTASVIRDATGEFHLEGGAMVLADGGVVCIDEFDKMRDEDRVAIHEAMEQQTISIAKAGITTILNSRCSVLAAANPTFGRYDDLKKATENIDFETTILSRFDLIFIIRDRRDEARDKKLARHILAVHMGKETEDMKEPEIDNELYKKYVAFCRQKIKPHLSEEAAELLRNQYVTFRTEAKRRQDENGMAAIPITVRQLEAVVRISESLAKMRLATEATIQHVQEAIRLFKISTMKAASAGGAGQAEFQNQSSEFVESVQKAERHVRRRIPLNSRVNYKNLISELMRKQHDEGAVRKAIDNMKLRGEVELQAQGRMVFRRA